MSKIQSQMEEILLYLEKNGQITLSEAMRTLDISDSTARRLFVAMEQKRLAVRARGMLRAYTANGGYSYEQHQIRHIAEKKAIGCAGAKLVESGDIFFLDWGTTASFFSDELVKRLKTEEIKRITVFTNSLPNIEKLCDYCQVMHLGGRFRPERKDFAGYLAEETIRRLNLKKAFICPDGFSATIGFAQFDMDSARINEIAVKNAVEKYVLMDSSKYSIPATVSCTGSQPIDALITDALPDDVAQFNIEHFTRSVILAEK